VADIQKNRELAERKAGSGDKIGIQGGSLLWTVNNLSILRRKKEGSHRRKNWEMKDNDWRGIIERRVRKEKVKVPR